MSEVGNRVSGSGDLRSPAEDISLRILGKGGKGHRCPVGLAYIIKRATQCLAWTPGIHVTLPCGVGHVLPVLCCTRIALAIFSPNRPAHDRKSASFTFHKSGRVYLFFPSRRLALRSDNARNAFAQSLEGRYSGQKSDTKTPPCFASWLALNGQILQFPFCKP